MASESVLRIGLDATPAKAGAAQYASSISEVILGATRLDKTLDQLDRSIIATDGAIRGVSSASTQASKALGTVQKDVAGLSSRFGDVAQEATAATRNLNTLDPALAKVGRTAQATASQLKALQSLQNLGGYGGAFNTIQDPAADVAGSPATAGAIGGLVARAGAAAAAISGIAIAARGAAAPIADFDKAIKQIEVIGGLDKSSKEFKDLVATARELGSTTQFGAGKVAGGLLELTKAGFDAKEAIATIRPALDLAVAGDISLQQSSETLLATLAQFGLQAAESNRVANVLVAQANASQSSVAGLADGFRVVGPLAKALGVSFEETAALLGTLNDSAIKGSEAGTGLRTILSSLLDPTARTYEALKDLGLTIEDIDPRTQGLTGVFRNLARAGLDAGNAFGIFGAYGATAGTVIAANIDKVSKYNDALQDVSGTAKDASNAIGDSLSGSFAKAGNAFEDLAIALGDAGLKSALEFTADFVGLIASGLSKVVKEVDALGAATRGNVSLPRTRDGALFGSLSSVDQQTQYDAFGRPKPLNFDGLNFASFPERPITYGESTYSGAALPPNLVQAPTAFQPLAYTLDIPFGPEAPPPADQFITYPSTGQQFGPEKGALSSLQDELDLRRELVGVSEQQKEIAEAIARAQEAAVLQFGPGSPEGAEAVAAYRSELEAVVAAENRHAAALKASEDAARKTAEVEAQRIADTKAKAAGIADAIADPVGRGINGALANVIDGKDFSAKQVGAAIGRDILLGLVNELITSVLVALIKRLIANLINSKTGGSGAGDVVVGAISGLSGDNGGGQYAMGGAFDNGRVIPFANGGYITNGPEYFPLAGGKTGLRGEAGAEAVLPLQRMGDGRLGVIGGGGGNIQIHITTPDADSFRRSEQHILADVKRARARYGIRDQ